MARQKILKLRIAKVNYGAPVEEIILEKQKGGCPQLADRHVGRLCLARTPNSRSRQHRTRLRDAIDDLRGAGWAAEETPSRDRKSGPLTSYQRCAKQSIDETFSCS